MKLTKVLLCWAVCLGANAPICQAAEPEIAFLPETGRLRITCDGQPLATYVIGDEQTPRPYLMDVYTSSGAQITRNHPPIEDQDLDDHPTYHPGIWLAFGDLSNADFWRNKATVRHIEFTDPPRSGAGRGSFAVKNRYESGDRALCEEICRIVITTTPEGRLIDWESTFTPIDRPLVFGDQEEMGLAVRMATPLAVLKRGEIQNSDGLRNEAQVWGKQADWCRYGGIVDGVPVGVVLMPDPANFRRSWFHARDYGLLVANPFGRRAFTKAEASRVIVPPGESLRLRFGVLVYGSAAAKQPDVQAAYQRFVESRRK